MIRIEIVANRSVEENILEALAKKEVGKHYTMIPSVLGVGACGPRMGTAVWPEENFALIIWCEEEEAQEIQQVITKIKEKFPGEGIKLFGI
jgi:nitrogen regulatory protein PII